MSRNILDYGGDNTNTFPNDAAFAAAIAACPANYPCVYFPQGTYKFSNSQTVALSATTPTGSVAINGDGADLTNLIFPANTSGISIALSTQYQSFHLRGFSVLTQNKGASTIGLNFKQNQTPVTNPANSALNTIENVTIRGSDGYNVANAWAYGINSDGISNLNLVSVNVTGQGGAYATTGVGFQAGSSFSAIIPVSINITGSTFNYCNYGFIYGPYLQGVTISQSNFVGDAVGIYAPSGETGLDELIVTGTQFNCNQFDIALISPVQATILTSNFFYIAGTSTTAVYLPQYTSGAINSNVFNGLGSNENAIVFGTYAGGGGAGFSVMGNSLFTFQTGIWMQPPSQYVYTMTNNFGAVATHTLNSGTHNSVGVATP